jgi:predicted pyridoxine 5'-phosphate oxidase superfamily flavin-nucleotide-binding protein
MPYRFLDIAGTPSVKAAQAANGSGQFWKDFKGNRTFDRFTEAEAEFIAKRDSFYMATVSESGWPYVQHRGGPPGFLRMLDEKTLAFADFRGNLQYISLGNLTASDRAALIMMDYPNRLRLKIYARIEVKDLGANPASAQHLLLPGYRAKPERAFLLHLEAFDWNCQEHITPRFTEAELEAALTQFGVRLGQLEAENKRLEAENRALLEKSFAANRDDHTGADTSAAD